MERTSTERPLDQEAGHRRRKVRKGTQSCWQCKRRKVRCIFSAPSGTVCDNCRRRGTACIGQEFRDDEPSPSKAEDRLSRVETVVDRLAGRGQVDGLLATTPGTPPGGSGRYQNLNNRLLAAWPSPHELDLILNLPASTMGLLQGWTCSPYSARDGRASHLTPCGQSGVLPADLLRLPPTGSHPAGVAKKLLLLASLLQGVRACDPRDVGGLSVARRDAIVSRVVETVRDQLTCHDDLIGCAVGLECLVMESMYYNNAGDLRRAWLVTRRAMATAQLMGLYRVRVASSSQEDNDGGVIDPTHTWFRLVQMDRYLSLMLGLPTGCADDQEHFASADALQACEPAERMRRLQCVAAGRILRRDQQRAATADDDLGLTYEIDDLLREAAGLMPPSWWLPPGVVRDETAETGTPCETFRVMDLLAHHHLLVRLHLPYLLSPSSSPAYDYSKTAAVNAAREVLSRFVAFRGSGSPMPYCRGVDFLAFIASATLCIAHMEAHRLRRKSGSGSDRDRSVFFSLAHQRPADRSLMERALAIVERMVRDDDNDSIAREIANILRPLLDVEADDGSDDDRTYHYYRTVSSSEQEATEERVGSLADGGTVVSICIPYYGTVRIERRGAESEWESREQQLDDGHGSCRQYSQKEQEPRPSPGYRLGSPPDWQAVPSGSDERQLFVPGLAESVDGWALQGVDTAFFDSLLGEMERPV